MILINIFLNRNHCKIVLAVLFFWLCSGGISAFAQSGGGVDAIGTGGQHTIQGRIYFPSGRTGDTRITVKLIPANGGELSVLTDNSGVFSFRQLVPGSYVIVIEAGEQYETVRESVFIDPGLTSINVRSAKVPQTIMVPIHLRLKNKDSEQKPGVINASLAAVPKPALEKFEKGLEFIGKNETSKAISQFEEAIKLHPPFAEAHSELGSAYLKQGKLDQAEPALRKALELNTKLVNARLDLGIVLLNKRQMAAAEKELREVIKANETFATPHMYLGIALMGLKQWEEAEKELLRAISLKDDEKIAQAHKYLGGLYMGYKRNAEAANELEKYLKLAPKASDAEKIRATIKQLREQN